MVINTRKSCCLRIGPRTDVTCASMYTTTGVALPWVNDLRYLGVWGPQFKNRSRVPDHSDLRVVCHPMIKDLIIAYTYAQTLTTLALVVPCRDIIAALTI